MDFPGIGDVLTAETVDSLDLLICILVFMNCLVRTVMSLVTRNLDYGMLFLVQYFDAHWLNADREHWLQSVRRDDITSYLKEGYI